MAARISLLIGVNNYAPSIGSLRYCSSDAQEIHKALNARREGYTATKSILLVDSLTDSLHPNRNNIIENVVEVCNSAQSGDTLIIHFSGHGDIDRDGNLYLLPNDANAASIKLTGLPWNWVKEMVESSKAKNKVIILDACHSGAGKQMGKDEKRAFRITRQLTDNTEGFVCISSCSGGQLSYEIDSLQQGLFTHYLIEGIKGAADRLNRGVISIDDLFKYTRESTIRYAKKIKVKQEPFIISKTSVRLSDITITSSAIEKPINSVLVLTDDPIIGSILETAIQLTEYAKKAIWKNDIDAVVVDAVDAFEFSAVYLDIRNHWNRRKKLIKTIRKNYPIVPFVLVGNRRIFLDSLPENERKIFEPFFFFDIEIPLSDIALSVNQTLMQVAWDIRVRFGERYVDDL